MATLSEVQIAALLRPYLVDRDAFTDEVCAKLSSYLDLLLKWNARTNLTAIRDPEEIVRRHFGESLYTAQHLGSCTTLLDFGSGAGFPGLPIAILRPEVRVTLAESQNKKASFLREAVRTLALDTEVWADRVESMLATRRFEAVTLRAVDHMAEAIQAAQLRADRQIVLLVTTDQPRPTLSGFSFGEPVPLPNSSNGCLLIGVRD